MASAANLPHICRSPLDRPTLTDSNRLYATLPNRYPTTIQTQSQKRRARQICRARRWRDARPRRKTGRGSLSPRELERKAPRSVWATQLPASRPIRWIARESREANRTDSPALGRPTPIQPFPNPDMDGIIRHATTSQPYFGSNTRTTRFLLNHPTSLIRQLQPILKNKSAASRSKLGFQK